MNPYNTKAIRKKLEEINILGYIYLLCKKAILIDLMIKNIKNGRQSTFSL